MVVVFYSSIRFLRRWPETITKVRNRCTFLIVQAVFLGIFTDQHSLEMDISRKLSSSYTCTCSSTILDRFSTRFRNLFLKIEEYFFLQSVMLYYRYAAPTPCEAQIPRVSHSSLYFYTCTNPRRWKKVYGGSLIGNLSKGRNWEWKHPYCLMNGLAGLLHRSSVRFLRRSLLRRAQHRSHCAARPFDVRSGQDPTEGRLARPHRSIGGHDFTAIYRTLSRGACRFDCSIL